MNAKTSTLTTISTLVAGALLTAYAVALIANVVLTY
jgi:hypothetical protein